MSQSLFSRLQRVRERYPDPYQQVPHLQTLAKLFRENVIVNGKQAIMERELWGQGYLKQREKYASRYDFFVFLCFTGNFHLAKRVLEYNNMPHLGYPIKSREREQVRDQIMYEVIHIIEAYIEKLGM
jgi:hypothetical protein